MNYYNQPQVDQFQSEMNCPPPSYSSRESSTLNFNLTNSAIRGTRGPSQTSSPPPYSYQESLHLNPISEVPIVSEIPQPSPGVDPTIGRIFFGILKYVLS